jgi:hypothetical protein
LAVAIAVIGYGAAGPFLTLHNIRTAINQQDASTLSDNIDFPALRTSLREQFNAAMVQAAAQTNQRNPYNELAMVFASKMVDSLVEATVTPAGLRIAMSGRASPSNDATSAPSPFKDPRDPWAQATYNFDSLSKFSVHLPTKEDSEVRLVLSRSWLSWRLTDLEIPLSSKPPSRKQPTRQH